MNNKKFRIKILSCWTILVMFLLSIPLPEYEGTGFSWRDKVVHVVMFGVFTYLLAYVLITFQGLGRKSLLLLALAAGVAYPALGEFIQNFVPGRTVSEYDFYAGVSGSLAALIIFYVQFFKKKT